MVGRVLVGSGIDDGVMFRLRSSVDTVSISYGGKIKIVMYLLSHNNC